MIQKTKTTRFGQMKRLLCFSICFLLLSLLTLPGLEVLAEGDAAETGAAGTARPSVNGRLHVDGTQLVDETGEAVQLRGVSTHGLTWYPEFLNGNLFGQISEDWDCSLVRLPMYSEVYCKDRDSRRESLALLKKGIDLAVSNDMYVIADWHILEDSDPNQHIEEAADFFEMISSEYAGIPNLIYEICNEPNGETGWADITKYSNRIIPVIRQNAPNALILVGTPEYDRNLGSSLLNPLDFDNIMYVLHFYAATHDAGLRSELISAVDAGLPVFVSECGISESNGDGSLDFASAREWFACLKERGISYTVWSFSDKDESSAVFRAGFDPEKQIEDRDLTVDGLWVRDLIRGKDPSAIPAPQAVVEKDRLSAIRSWITGSLGDRGYQTILLWHRFALASLALLLAAAVLFLIIGSLQGYRTRTYDDIGNSKKRRPESSGRIRRILTKIVLALTMLFTLIYLGWRITFSVPFEAGILAVGANLILLVVEILGFVESMVLFHSLMKNKDHPLPQIPEEAWPDVDIFIATYNEPEDLLRRTINGCVHLKYPDPSRVHIYVCDDNRRPQMRQLAEEMGVNYFDRPDNRGAKAGNLNHALARTSSPYIVTLDADMIPKSDFLLKTIPYFVDAELKNKGLPEDRQIHLGLLQTPQCFYDPDVFQHALYSEKRVPNEQDFFYRTIEPARTSTNSVIYGGSNTVLSRKALEEIGGFYTGSITEDFATGVLIEAAGFVSLGLGEPLASGQTPHTYQEHIQQRTRWGRGVIVTAKKLKIMQNKKLTPAQKMSYWSSVVYWYSPIKNLIYILSPLLFATFALPVFKCSWLELLVFWLPMYILQDVNLKLCSRGTISNKWSGIYETGVMPHMLIPILKESVGISLSTFKVTDKSAKKGRQESDLRSMVPFLLLILLSVAGIVRIILIFQFTQIISLCILLFWIIRNLYFLVLSLFLVDGRDSDQEPVKVMDAVPVTVTDRDGSREYEGVTTLLTEHNMTVFLDDGESLLVGTPVNVTVTSEDHCARVAGVVTNIMEARKTKARTQTIEILDFGSDYYEYLEHLYDRIPTLPQSYNRDFGILPHLWQNIAHRVARTAKM
ncbi:MAG: cellulase family glycosylhydrolase [Eubacteriales bacterium]|nr:cellulase family glycosylhydrolase [Eubacteriales bacterium]